MSNKTISISPNLFQFGGKSKTKTRSKREKPEKIMPLISPNVLKSKLLKRIKEHKSKETHGFGKPQISIEDKGEDKKSKVTDTASSFSDEFNDSVNYLQMLSKQKEKQQLERKTVRNHHSIAESPHVNLELPEELKEPVVDVIAPSMRLHKPSDVPYGVLKGGKKPCYREWTKTQRNLVVTNPNSSLIIQSPREKRLAMLRAKIHSKQALTKKEPAPTESEIESLPSVQVQVQAPIPTPVSVEVARPPSVPTIIPTKVAVPVSVSTPVPVSAPVKPQIQATTIPPKKLIATKHITKKTIKRKYTLGKSRIKKTVGVLIKDKGTRKQVLTAQRELKRKNINDIKAYLRDHNLLKVGSNAPNDVVRKMYESSMLAGEITNGNSDTLLHNFAKEDKEL